MDSNNTDDIKRVADKTDNEGLKKSIDDKIKTLKGDKEVKK